MGVKEGELPGLVKGAQEKQVLAWRLRSPSVVSLGWVSERLPMGDESDTGGGGGETDEGPEVVGVAGATRRLIFLHSGTDPLIIL